MSEEQFKEQKISRDLLFRKYDLGRTPTQKENNKLELYKITDNGLKLLITFYEVWSQYTPKKSYKVKVVPSEGIDHEYVKEMTSLLLPISDFSPKLGDISVSVDIERMKK